MQVCTSGLVSFGAPITSTTSGSIPRTYGPPFISANWRPYHTYRYHSWNKGRVYYRSTSSGVDRPNDFPFIESNDVAIVRYCLSLCSCFVGKMDVVVDDSKVEHGGFGLGVRESIDSIT